jgi:hypothetical protein
MIATLSRLLTRPCSKRVYLGAIAEDTRSPCIGTLANAMLGFLADVLMGRPAPFGPIGHTTSSEARHPSNDAPALLEPIK